MKWVRTGNNKSSVDCKLLHHLYLLRFHPYGVSSLIEVKYELLMNTIFLMDGVFRFRTHLLGVEVEVGLLPMRT